jgi:hypothetical protein
MTQSDLDRAVARRTGESTARIRRMGFVLLTPHARRRGQHARSPGERNPAPHQAGSANHQTACPE